MSGPNKRTPTRYGIELSHESCPGHEANRIVQMVRSGTLSVDQARVLIGVNEGQAAVLLKILEPRTADAAITFRQNVLRLFDALIQPARTRAKRRTRARSNTLQ